MNSARTVARSRVIAAAFTVFTVLFLGGLGAWQVERLHWKNGLIAAREAALAAPVASPPATPTAALDLEFHPITIEGTFLYDNETYKHAIGPKGELGFDVMTPLRNGTGRIVLVDRGFVPVDRRALSSRAAGNPAATTRVQGFIRSPPATKPGWFIPDNKPQAGEWFWLDLPALAATQSLPDMMPFYYIQAGPAPNRGGWPKGSSPDPKDLPNNHLQYAITWFSLALAAAVIYVLSQRRSSRTPPPA
jgi:surfeit locus 1 family protein